MRASQVKTSEDGGERRHLPDLWRAPSSVKTGGREGTQEPKPCCERRHFALLVRNCDLKIALRAVEQSDDCCIDMPDIVWPQSTNSDGGLGWMDALAWSPPTAFANKSGPCSGGGEDLADALGVASESAKGHVTVFGRQDHVLDGGQFDGGELARARMRARRPVCELAGILGSPPGVVAAGFQVEDAQDNGQGKECFGAGDGAKNAGLGFGFRKPIPGEAEAGSTEQGEQQANNSSEHPSLFLPPGAGIESMPGGPGRRGRL